MAATFGVCGPSPTVTVIGRPIDRVFEDAQFTGEVNLSGRKLRDYPKICDKYDLADTIHTDLSKNRLSELPPEVCQYRYMERLNCYHNFIKAIPSDLSQLQALTHLNLSRNQLTTIPVCVCSLSSLEVLLVSNNKLLSLPEQIGQLQRLMDLDVSCNEITHLPSQIGDLRSLRSLNVRRNLLVELPVDICKLNLILLEISCNRIQKIPTVFCKLEALECMVLEHNPLECPPAHMCRRGRQHILKFLHMEAIREDRKRGFLSDTDMKRLLRKSLPNQPPSDEFRSMLEGPEGKWKRHTVLSSDSGYSTADSLDRSGFNQTELEQQGMMGEADDVLALKAGEAVREQRHGHNAGGVNGLTSDLAQGRGGHLAKSLGSALPMATRCVSRLPCSGGGGGGVGEGGGKNVSNVPADDVGGGGGGKSISEDNSPPCGISASPTPSLTGKSPRASAEREGSQPVRSDPSASPSSLPPPSSKPQNLSGVSSSSIPCVIPSPSSQGASRRPLPGSLELKGGDGEGGGEVSSSSSSSPGEGVVTPETPPTPLAQQVLGVAHDEFARELKLQKEDYQRKKKEAEQIRLAQEEKEGEERRRAARRQEDKNAPSTQSKAEGRRSDPHTPDTPKAQTHRGLQHKAADAHKTEGGRADAQRGSEGGRRKGKRRSAEGEPGGEVEGVEEMVTAQLKTSAADRQEPGSTEDNDSRRPEPSRLQGDAPLNKAARTSAGVTPSSKDASRRIPNCQYRRTSSDTTTTPRRGIPTVISSRRHTEDQSHLFKNGGLEEEDPEHKPSHSSKPGHPATSATGGGEQTSAPARRGKGGERSQVPTPTSTRSTSKAVSGDASLRGGGGTTVASTASRSKTPQTPEEEPGHRQPTAARTGTEPSHPKSRLEDPRSKAAAKSRAGGGDGEGKRVATATRSGGTSGGKTGRSDQSSRLHLSSGRPSALPCKQTTARSLEDVKESVSNASGRRRPEQPREDSHHHALLRQMIESRLKVALPDQLSDALRDGVVLCHLANHIRPRSVATIHVPSPAVPKLTSAKARRNVESFLEACRKIGVDQDQMCTAADITEERGLPRLSSTVSFLVALAT